MTRMERRKSRRRIARIRFVTVVAVLVAVGFTVMAYVEEWKEVVG